MMAGVVAGGRPIAQAAAPAVFPELRVSGISGTLGVTSHQAVLPSGWQVGDLCLIVAAFDGTTNITTPVGWGVIKNIVNGVRAIVISRVLQAGDASPTFTSLAQTRFRSINTVWKAGTFNTGVAVSGPPPNSGFGYGICPAVTGAASDGVFIQTFCGEADVNITPGAFPLPDNNIFTQSTSGGASSSYVGLGMCSKTDSTGSVALGTFSTANTTNYVGITLRIPAP